MTNAKLKLVKPKSVVASVSSTPVPSFRELLSGDVEEEPVKKTRKKKVAKKKVNKRATSTTVRASNVQKKKATKKASSKRKVVKSTSATSLKSDIRTLKRDIRNATLQIHRLERCCARQIAKITRDTDKAVGTLQRVRDRKDVQLAKLERKLDQ